MYEMIKDKNPQVEIFHVNESELDTYGKIVEGYDFTDLINYMVVETKIPEKGNIYKPSINAMEETDVHKELMKRFYGGMDIQIGFCNGQNSSLNGLEYHKGSEILVAVTDLVLLLGNLWDIHNNQYDSKKIKGFFIPKGTAIELYSTTLHLAPCKVEDEGFKSIIILPRGTNWEMNNDFQINSKEDLILFKKNKWLLVHPENANMIKQNAHIGIVGSNISIRC